MKVAVIGAGLMSRAIVSDLLNFQGIGDIVVLDRNEDNLNHLEEMFRGFSSVTLLRGDINDASWLESSVSDCRVMIGAVPYSFNSYLLEMAIEGGAHFVDLGGNMAIVREQFELDGKARGAGITAIPACGLAPGTLSILVMRGVERLDEAVSVRMYCGGLPVKPEPPLEYQIVFSPDGLINEYVEPVEVIVDGEIQVVPPLTGLEPFRLEAIEADLEAFYTSGNIGTIIQTLKGEIRDLAYRTVRYAGHRDKVKLLFDLGFGSEEPFGIGETGVGADAAGFDVVTPRKVLEKMLEKNLPSGGPDLVIAMAVVGGKKRGRDIAITLSFLDHADHESGLSAMARCTGFSAAIVAGMLGRGEIREKGVVPLEKVVSPEKYITDLRDRGIEVKETK